MQAERHRDARTATGVQIDRDAFKLRLFNLHLRLVAVEFGIHEERRVVGIFNLGRSQFDLIHGRIVNAENQVGNNAAPRFQVGLVTIHHRNQGDNNRVFLLDDSGHFQIKVFRARSFKAHFLQRHAFGIHERKFQTGHHSIVFQRDRNGHAITLSL